MRGIILLAVVTTVLARPPELPALSPSAATAALRSLSDRARAALVVDSSVRGRDQRYVDRRERAGLARVADGAVEGTIWGIGNVRISVEGTIWDTGNEPAAPVAAAGSASEGGGDGRQHVDQPAEVS